MVNMPLLFLMMAAGWSMCMAGIGMFGGSAVGVNVGGGFAIPFAWNIGLRRVTSCGGGAWAVFVLFLFR